MTYVEILTAGKYVSVLLEYGVSLPELEPAHFAFSLNPREYAIASPRDASEESVELTGFV